YKTSLTIPFKLSRPLLGTWQQVVFIDFDTHPRRRKVFITLI
ncbi:MAG: YjbQ family protein, partial [bacterium]|nr:YjbQ family protein [bacterium]